MNEKTLLVLGGLTVLYLALRKQDDEKQLTAAQIIERAKRELAPLGKPIVVT